MWVPILICLAAGAMVLGPILLMRPTSSQQREMHLRQKAAELGLRVHLQSPPKGTLSETGQSTLPFYTLPWPNGFKTRAVWSLVRRGFAHEMHFSGVWDAVDKQGLPKPESLPGLVQVPAVVLAISANPQGVGVFWTEGGKLETVEQIAQWLKVISEQIQAG